MAERVILPKTTTRRRLGIGTRAIALFIGMAIFAAPGVLCMLIGFVVGAHQKREFREEAMALA